MRHNVRVAESEQDKLQVKPRKEIQKRSFWRRFFSSFLSLLKEKRPSETNKETSPRRSAEHPSPQIPLVLPAKVVYNTLYYYAQTQLCSSISVERKSDMIKVPTENGEITISDAVFTTITGAAATNCFGVKGMAQRSMTDGLVHLLRPEAMSKGVKVTYNDDGTVSIELHIIVENGVNLVAVCRSIINQVRYMVSENTGASIRSIDVCVDSMNM